MNLERKVAYFSDDEEGHAIVDPGAPVDDRDWHDYVKDKTKKEKLDPSFLKELAKKKKVSDNPEPSTNLYDYKGPRDKAKEQDTPSVNEYFDTYNVGHPDIYDDEDGVFKRIRNEGDRDPSEELQYPEMSLDTKREAAYRVLAKYFHDIESQNFVSRTSATLKEIIQKDSHRSHAEKIEESKKCSISDVSKPSEKKSGKFTFKVKAADSPNIRTCIFQFLKEPGSKKVFTPNLLEYPVLIGCSCPSFLWWGAQYYALEGKYMFLPMFRPSKKAPVPEDLPSSISQNGKVNYGRGLNFTICKHLLAAANKLRTVKIESEDYLAYKPKGPRQRTFNPTQWEKSFGVFSFSDIINLQKKGVIPKTLVTRVKNLENYSEIEQFLNNDKSGWKSWSDKQKTDYIKNLVGHPDLTLYIMLRDYQITGRQSPLLRESLYDSLDTVMQFDDGEDKIIKNTPELLDEYAKEKGELKKLLDRSKTRSKQVRREPEKFVTELVTDTVKDKEMVDEDKLRVWFGRDWKRGQEILHKLLTRFK